MGLSGSKAQKSSGPQAASSRLKRPAKRINRDQIGLPQNFQHTGHIGIGDMRAGFDPTKVKDQMASIGAPLTVAETDEQKADAKQRITARLAAISLDDGDDDSTSKAAEPAKAEPVKAAEPVKTAEPEPVKAAEPEPVPAPAAEPTPEPAQPEAASEPAEPEPQPQEESPSQEEAPAAAPESTPAADE